MKTKKLPLIILLSFLTVSLFSCKKKKTEEPTKSEIISKKTWNWVKIEHYNDGALTQTEDKTGYKWDFKQNHSLNIIKPDGNIEIELTWDINKDETILFLSANPDEAGLFDIEKLTENELIISYSEVDNDIDPPIFESQNKISSSKSIFYFNR
jgi:hypothetical protein